METDAVAGLARALSSDQLIVPRKSIDIAMLPEPRILTPPPSADGAAVGDATTASSGIKESEYRSVSSRGSSDEAVKKRAISESYGVEVVSVEMATLNITTTTTTATSQSANAATAITSDAPKAQSPQSKSSITVPTTTVEVPSASPPIWLPSELFAAIADDTFFAFLEAFNLQLSAFSGLHHKDQNAPNIEEPEPSSLPSVIPINQYVDSHGKTLLHHACRFGKTQVVKSLLFHGINALAECQIGRTAFHDAISSGNKAYTLEMVQLLYDHEPRGISIVDTNGSHILHLAAIHGCLDVIQWYTKLLSKSSIESVASKSAIPALVPMSITSFSGRNLLHYAAYNGRLRVLQWVLSSENVWNFEFSASALDSNGYSLLHYAAMGGHMEVCEWLVYHSSTRNDLNIIARNSEGQTAFDLAKTLEVKTFVAQVSQLPSAPSNVHCVGADSSSLGIAWEVELHADLLLREVLTPIWFELEYCKKPKGLTSASGLLSMVMMMPSSASPFILKWEQLPVRMQPSAREYWLSGLERDTEYLVRMRAVNRNGGSTYSMPNLAFGEFTTTGSTAGGLKRILSLFPRSSSSNTAQQPSFIGTLHFELLEARHLHVGLNRNKLSRKQKAAADHGHFYSMITMEMPDMMTVTTPTRRRQTVPMMALKRSTALPPKNLYRVRTESASIQEEMVLSGSIHAFQHPAFHLATVFRVPEASNATLTIEIRHKTYRVDSCVGVVKISLMDFVRGLPAKMQWLSLGNAAASGSSSSISQRAPSSVVSPRKTVQEIEPIRGEILIRTLFLADGITSLPHPTRSGVMSSSAQELLEDQIESSCSKNEEAEDESVDNDSDGSGSSSFYGPSSFSRATSSTFDAMGFRIFDPRTLTKAGVSLQRKILCKSYPYYKLLQECVDKRQTYRWQAFHHKFHGDTVVGGGCSESMLKSSCCCDCVGGADTTAKQQHQQLMQTSQCPYEARSNQTLRLLVWNGVPASWRPAIYMRMSGAQRMRASHPDTYFKLLLQRISAHSSRACALNTTADNEELSAADQQQQQQQQSETTQQESSAVTRRFEAAEKQIQVDLQRTFAANQCWINSKQGQASLERVLLAYAVHNQSLGYCQSMTFIVGRLLCLFTFHKPQRTSSSEGEDTTVDAEEQVFWMLAVFCEQFFPTYYTKGMAGLQVDGMVLEFLMRKRLPKVYRHLQQLQTPHIGLLLVTQWLLPICCAVFPSETSFRMMDVLIFEGSKAVFALAIALLRVSQHDILAETKDYMQLFRFLKERDMRLYDTSLLLEIAYEEHVLLEGEIEELRRGFKQEVECQHGNRA